MMRQAEAVVHGWNLGKTIEAAWEILDYVILPQRGGGAERAEENEDEDDEEEDEVSLLLARYVLHDRLKVGHQLWGWSVWLSHFWARLQRTRTFNTTR
jgi:hypothetical protein